MRVLFLLPTSAVLLLLAFPAAARGASCAELAKLTLPETTIVSATAVADGRVELPYGEPLTKVPAFCRVVGMLQPTADSQIRFEVWLPETGWNGRFLGVGNGGFAGSIYYGQMAGNLRRGFATAGTDAGHQAEAEDASWAYRHPEKVVDYGWRALHLTTDRAKQIVAERYGKAATKSYFDACSDGGREALMEAERFPEDYDGILAGAPANDWTGLLAAGLDVNKVLDGDPAAYFSAMKLPAITKAVLAACDAADGLKDGILSDPLACKFDPKVLQCKDGDALTCLTAPQVGALEKLYAGGVAKNGRVIFPGLLPGDEAGQWKSWIIGDSPHPSAYVQGYFRYMVYSDPKWNSLAADVGAAEKLAKERTGMAVDAVDPDLSRFIARGGKLMLYHGWNDPAISPKNTIGYYGQVQQKIGAETAAGAVRLYVVPGMGHCGGGSGPSAFGQLGIPTAAGGDPFAMFSALEGWVEQGKAPGEIVATQYSAGGDVVRTRPVCAFPKMAKYDGAGDVAKAASFKCE